MTQRFESARLPDALFQGGLNRREPLAAAEVIARVVTGDLELEGYRPLPLNFEWRLSALHWIRTGVTPFITNDVPYLVNNNGRASADAAAVLFANCLEAPSAGPIRVLELGAGSALFARYFLDEFRALCQRHGRDFYDRLSMYVTDGSPSSVTRWSEAGLFAAHAAHVETGVCDAQRPDGIVDGPVRAVFANYVLDSLPAAVLRWSGSSWQQLCARASIRKDAVLPRSLASRGTEWLRQAASGQHPEEFGALLPLLPIVESELAFLPIDGDGPPDFERHLSPPEEPITKTVNYPYGALQCLDAIIPQLDPDGFVLVRDYSSGSAEPRFVGAQRFGDATALPLNFALLERHLHGAGVDVVCPADASPMHTRLLTRAAIAATRQAFVERFSTRGQASDSWRIGAVARERADQGLHQEALGIYREAIADHPGDWQLIAAAAQFTASVLGDPAASLELACLAVQLNPWYSPYLWNVLGESLTLLGRHDEARDCHLEAARVHPGDAETYVYLAKSWLTLGDSPRSLEAVARGLASDVDAMHRQALLAVQQAAIEELARLGTARREAAGRRQARAGALGAASA